MGERWSEIEIRSCQGTDGGRIANRAGSKRWGRELHHHIAQECEAAEWRGVIMCCEASSHPSSQAIAGLVQSVSVYKDQNNLSLRNTL